MEELNPFLTSVESVLPQLGITDIKKKDIKSVESRIEGKEVAIAVGLTGDIKGTVVYTMHTDTAKKIASIMMCGMEVISLDSMSKSALSELSNMITATTATCYNVLGKKVDISTPNLIHGDFSIDTNVEKINCICMLIDSMEFNINIAIEA